ncbi:MAG: (2Fe-2S)-binding protein [Dehalococcoidia bacterium]|nr:(2Fe-2S)-binding protein [Dehalococcoidia bacterium]
MSEEKQTGHISRREFLKDAGLIVGGATIGSIALVNACSDKTVTVPAGTTTVTVPGSGGSSSSDVITLNINDREYKVQVKPYWPLSFVLRDKLGLFGTKVGCEYGQCASCTVLQDGMPVLSCLVLAVEAEGKKYTTVEGLASAGNLSQLQQKWYDNEAFQCGYCTPGFLVAATALLASNSRPSLDDVREAFSGHICSCYNFKLYIENTVGGV